MGICLVVVFIFMVVAGTSMLATDSGWDVDYDSDSSSSSGGGDLIFLVLRLILLVIEYPVVGIPVCILVIFLLISTLKPKKGKKVDPIQNIHFIEASAFDPNTKAILLRAYQVFYDTQIAWMNFDHEKLRNLLTDELYNTYKNQLDTLQLKGQKNIMDNFILRQIGLQSQTVEENVETTVIFLSISFYDYVVDASGKVVRGKKSTMVTMQYKLTFVANIVAQEVCPSCGAPLTKQNFCEYCRSPIQGLSADMRLAKKEVIHQTTGGM